VVNCSPLLCCIYQTPENLSFKSSTAARDLLYNVKLLIECQKFVRTTIYGKTTYSYILVPTICILMVAFRIKYYSFCLIVEASDHGYVLHTRRIHVTRYRIRIQHQWRLEILIKFSVLIYAVCHILPSFFSYQGCVVHRWVFGVP
jgi:uncharacterized protein (DUF486 family)